MLQFALASTLRPYANNVSSVLLALWMTVCTMAASWAQLTEHEAGIIALPFAWLSAKTVQMLLLQWGIQAREVDEKKAAVAQIGVMSVFLVAHWRAVGVPTDFVVLMLLWEGVTQVYRWLYLRNKVKGGEEK